MVLKEPYGLVLEALGKTGANVPFMMPKRVAETDAQHARSTTPPARARSSSRRDEWKAGREGGLSSRIPKYKPRAEPPSGLAGGKVAKVDRVEWIWIADPQTQVNALLNGEIDLIQITPYDLLPLIDKSKDVATQVVDRPGRQFIMRFNTLAKPFDDARIRQAVTYALTQKRVPRGQCRRSRATTGSASRCSLRPAARIDRWAGRTGCRATSPRPGSCWTRRAMTARRWCCCTRPTWSATTTSPPWPSRSSSAPASRSTCRRWTGRRW